MKKMDKIEILQQYETSGKIIFDSELIGDYKTGNREAKKLISIFKLFEKDHALADECIPLLLESKNVVVRSKGAAYCLALNRHVDVGEKVLTEISLDGQYGIWRFAAEMTLKQWHETGHLVLYQKRQKEKSPPKDK